MHLIILTTNRCIEWTTFTDLSMSVEVLKVLPHPAIGIVKKLYVKNYSQKRNHKEVVYAVRLLIFINFLLNLLLLSSYLNF